MNAGILALMIFYGLHLGGASGVIATPSPTPLQEFNVWRSVGAIVFVLAGLLAIHAFIKRRYIARVGTGSNKRIRVLERLVLDHRRSLVLADADGHRVLFGISPDRMDSIAVLGKEDGSSQ